ncbi:MAG: hypothetical protein U1A22_08595 [Xanthomonadaceae bacterium]|nr:hypothetical protein [Xanthomonadaceae bacterium]
MSTEDEFNARLRTAIQICHELGYHPTRFTQMLDNIGAQATAARLVVSGEFHDGFRELIGRDRADLTMERIMLEPEFATLFTPEQLAAARWRLV